MYDAIDDPYTYESSTVLVNKLDLRDQDVLDAYEAEISNADRRSLYPKAISISSITVPSTITCFRMSTTGRANPVQCVYRNKEIRSVFPSTSKLKLPSYSQS